jgi:hypothetical protein
VTHSSRVCARLKQKNFGLLRRYLSDTLRAPSVAMKFVVALLSLAFAVSPRAVAQQAVQVQVTGVQTSFGFATVTPNARFSHQLGGSGAAGSEQVTLFYRVSDCGSGLSVELRENGISMAQQPCDNLIGSISYSPRVPGRKILTVVANTGDPGTISESSGVEVQMYGISLSTSVGGTQTQPFLPMTSRIFLQTDVGIVDANVKKFRYSTVACPFRSQPGSPTPQPIRWFQTASCSSRLQM